MGHHSVGAEFLHSDRHEEANSRFSQCCERVWKWRTRVCLFRNVVIWVRWSCEIMELGTRCLVLEILLQDISNVLIYDKHLFKLATAMSWPLCVCFRPPFEIKNSRTQQESTTFLYPVLQVPIPCCNIKTPSFLQTVPWHRRSVVVLSQMRPVFILVQAIYEGESNENLKYLYTFFIALLRFSFDSPS